MQVVKMQGNYERFRSFNVPIVEVSVNAASDTREMVEHAKSAYPVPADPST